ALDVRISKGDGGKGKEGDYSDPSSMNPVSQATWCFGMIALELRQNLSPTRDVLDLLSELNTVFLDLTTRDADITFPSAFHSKIDEIVVSSRLPTHIQAGLRLSRLIDFLKGLSLSDRCASMWKSCYVSFLCVGSRWFSSFPAAFAAEAFLLAILDINNAASLSRASIESGTPFDYIRLMYPSAAEPSLRWSCEEWLRLLTEVREAKAQLLETMGLGREAEHQLRAALKAASASKHAWDGLRVSRKLTTLSLRRGRSTPANVMESTKQALSDQMESPRKKLDFSDVEAETEGEEAWRKLDKGANLSWRKAASWEDFEEKREGLLSCSLYELSSGNYERAARGFR
ncbi:MAG: hypothetical protein AAFY15_16580, partial [Cyanobacteria bacterium J06648_11]